MPNLKIENKTIHENKNQNTENALYSKVSKQFGQFKDLELRPQKQSRWKIFKTAINKKIVIIKKWIVSIAQKLFTFFRRKKNTPLEENRFSAKGTFQSNTSSTAERETKGITDSEKLEEPAKVTKKETPAVTQKHAEHIPLRTLFPHQVDRSDYDISEEERHSTFTSEEEKKGMDNYQEHKAAHTEQQDARGLCAKAAEKRKKHPQTPSQALKQTIKEEKQPVNSQSVAQAWRAYTEELKNVLSAEKTAKERKDVLDSAGKQLSQLLPNTRVSSGPVAQAWDRYVNNDGPWEGVEKALDRISEEKVKNHAQTLCMEDVIHAK